MRKLFNILTGEGARITLGAAAFALALCFDAAGFGGFVLGEDNTVTRRCIAADGHRLVFELRMLEQFDAGIKRIGVHVQNNALHRHSPL